MIRRSAAAGPAAPARRYRVLLVAGEASGDLHGADLLAALRTRLPDVEVFGIGGGRLREAGMETVADAGEVATVGVTEVVGRLRTLLRAYRALVRTLRAEPPAPAGPPRRRPPARGERSLSVSARARAYRAPGGGAGADPYRRRRGSRDRGRHLQPDRGCGPGARHLRDGDARVRAARVPDGHRLPPLAADGTPRPPPHSRRAAHRDAQHRRRSR